MRSMQKCVITAFINKCTVKKTKKKTKHIYQIYKFIFKVRDNIYSLNVNENKSAKI